MFVITNSVTTQLVIVGELGGGDTVVYEGIQATVDALDEVQAQIDLRACQYVEPETFSILTFAADTPVVEVGATVASPSFTASYENPTTLVELDDDEGTPTKDVTSTPAAFASDGSFQKTANNDSVQFTLDATRITLNDTANTSIAWRPRTFWGLGGAALLTEAQIEALAGNALDNNFNRTFSVNAAGATDYVWYCFPQSYDPTDAATFQVGVFPGGFQKIGVVSVTNPNGVVQNYACWRSDFPQLGSITVQVF